MILMTWSFHVVYVAADYKKLFKKIIVMIVDIVSSLILKMKVIKLSSHVQ